MQELEVFKRNVHINDKYDVQKKKVDKSVCCDDLHDLSKTRFKNEPNEAPPLFAAVIGENNTAAPFSSVGCDRVWSDFDATELYLKTKPTSFLILSKPGVNAFKVGEEISKKYNCIHFCPRLIVEDELGQGGPTGDCLDYNMRHNNISRFDTLLKIMEKKMNSAVVKHRGFVISGFPMIYSNRKEYYLFKPLNAEETLEVLKQIIDDLLTEAVKPKQKKHKKPKPKAEEFEEEASKDEEMLPDFVEEEEQPEEEDQPFDMPKFVLEPCSNVINNQKSHIDSNKASLVKQYYELLNLEMKPDVIVYISCCDADVIKMKQQKYINYANDNLYAKKMQSSVKPAEMRWPKKYSIFDYSEAQQVFEYDEKYSCRQPLNWEENATHQLCNYNEYIVPFIEKHLKGFNPKFLIRVDGRTSVNEMMHNITKRLLHLPIQPIYLPEPLAVEGLPEEISDFWKGLDEEKIATSGVLNFSRYPSPWLNRCPVMLKRRKSIVGKTKLAVAFLKHVYLMSSFDCLVEFCRNPRTYLKLAYLEPTCRIFVTGTKLSGKTMISKCLSWIFDAPIIDYNTFVDKEKQIKYNTYSATILSEIIATIEDNRLHLWENAELARLTELDTWYNATVQLLKKYVPMFEKFIEFEGIPDSEFVANIEDIKSKLNFIDFLDDIIQCKQALFNKKILLKLAPKELSSVTPKPAVPLLGDKDVTDAVSEYIATNELQGEIEPTSEELMKDFVKILNSYDYDISEHNKVRTKYGKWIVDGFPCNTEIWSILENLKALPDNTIVLIENRTIEDDLKLYYKEIEKATKYYNERYIVANDPLIKIKLRTKNQPDENLYQTLLSMVNDIINTALESLATIESEESSPEDLDANMNIIRECWDSIKINLEENQKCFVEVELEGKSDIQIIEEVLFKLRQSYFLVPEAIDLDEGGENLEEARDFLVFNSPRSLGDTGVYCPVTYYERGLLWQGKLEFAVKFDDKVIYLSSTENMVRYNEDPTKYQQYNIPFKKIPCLRICVVGCVGSGKSVVAKYLAKELGLIHVDILDYINNNAIPKHYKKIGYQYENSFNDNEEEMVTENEQEKRINLELGEENADGILSEEEMREMLTNYFERGSPLYPSMLKKVLNTLWFEEPYCSIGIVLDGFPRMPSDVDEMIAYQFIPDLTIEIESSAAGAVERVAPIMLSTWKLQLAEAKTKSKQKFYAKKQKWLNTITKIVVPRSIYEDLLDVVFEKIPHSIHGDEEETDRLSNYGSTIIDTDPTGTTKILNPHVFNIYNEVIEEFPAPEYTPNWDQVDEVKEKIEERLDSIYEIQEEQIESMKDMLSENNIHSLAVENKDITLNKLLRTALMKLKECHSLNRNESFFEMTYLIKNDVAEKLLSMGFLYLSNFYRICPVYIYENPQCILNPFEIYENDNELYYVAHRSYLFFIFSKENVIKFRSNPLKYVLGHTVDSFVEFPLTISVIGPPKSGKSAVTAKLAKLGLLPISKGAAIRHVLDHMPWSDLALKIDKNLRSGECIDVYLIMQAIKIVVLNRRIYSYGFVFDGFPETAVEAYQLSKEGLYPLFVIDLKSIRNKVLKNSQSELYLDIQKYMPPYSAAFVKFRFLKWNEARRGIRDFVNNDYHNIYEINAEGSQWSSVHGAYNVILDKVPKIHYYLTNVNKKIVPVDIMCISNETFQQRMSSFKNFCPLCFRKNLLRQSYFPVDKKGVVQYKNTFYWICAEHMKDVMELPDCHLAPCKVEFPEIAAPVSHVDVCNVYENGVCIVTYANSLPAQNINRGQNQYAAAYKGRFYLFCSFKCLQEFLEKPQLYWDITVFKHKNILPQVSLNALPHLGYLEQTLGNVITSACCYVNVLRPKYPGLDPKLSGAILIALYLKINNPLAPTSHVTLYKKCNKIYEARSKIPIDVGLYLRSMDNPFAKYPACHHTKKGNKSVQRLPTPVSSTSSKSFFVASRVPVPDERFDFLCEYHKPLSKVPAFLNVVDIAGLVKGAAEGQGLGNAFLSHIKACDAIFNLCRAFDDEDVIHVDGDVNPVRDLETIGEELRLKDEEQLLQHIEKLDRQVVRGNDKKLKPEYDALIKIKGVLVDEKKHIRFGDWSAADIEVLNKYLFLTSKPALYLVNLSEKDYIRKKNKWLPKLKEWIDKNDPGAPLIPFSGALENKLFEMEPAERDAFLKENNLTSALDKIIVMGYKALQLEYFFTAGADEVKAWTIQKGTKAPQAAGRIHTDFEKGFIMAEVMHFKDFREEGSEAACKSAGKYRQQGRNYVVEDGDVIFFKFNAGAGLKDAKKK